VDRHVGAAGVSLGEGVVDGHLATAPPSPVDALTRDVGAPVVGIGADRRLAFESRGHRTELHRNDTGVDVVALVLFQFRPGQAVGHGRHILEEVPDVGDGTLDGELVLDLHTLSSVGLADRSYSRTPAGPFLSRRNPAPLPRRTASISPMIAQAISTGPSAPMSRPAGPCKTARSCSSGNWSRSARSRRSRS